MSLRECWSIVDPVSGHRHEPPRILNWIEETGSSQVYKPPEFAAMNRVIIIEGHLRTLNTLLVACNLFMNQSTTLFKGSETSFGVFYPKKYIIATFPSLQNAISARYILRNAGFHLDDVRAVSGDEMLSFFHELHVRTRLLGDLMTEFSRLIGTEAVFFDRDVWEARHGAGFLIVPCVTELDADRIRKLLTPLHPSAMQWYRMGAVWSLV